MLLFMRLLQEEDEKACVCARMHTHVRETDTHTHTPWELQRELAQSKALVW